MTLVHACRGSPQVTHDPGVCLQGLTFRLRCGSTGYMTPREEQRRENVILCTSMSSLQFGTEADRPETLRCTSCSRVGVSGSWGSGRGDALPPLTQILCQHGPKSFSWGLVNCVCRAG